MLLTPENSPTAPPAATLSAVTTDAVAGPTFPFRRWLAAILLAALLIRLGWCLYQPTDDESLRALPDQVEYLTLARGLLESGSLRFHDDRFNQTLYAYRMPGYPAFLAACLANARSARIVQALLDTSTALAAGLLARILFPAAPSRRGMLIAAGIVAVNPFLIFFSGLLLSETLFAAMLCWGMVLLLAGARGGRFGPEPELAGDVEEVPTLPPIYRRRRGTVLWLSGGLLIALSSLVRPSAPPLTIMLGLLASLAARPTDRTIPSFRPAWPFPTATTMLLLTVAVLAPWAYRNSVTVNAWVWTTTNGGVTAWDGFNPDAKGDSNQLPLKDIPQLMTMNEVDRSTYLGDRAARFARENTRRALELAVIKAGRTWSPVPLSDEYGDWKRRIVGFAYCVPLFLFAAIGLIRSPLTRSAKGFLIAPAVYFTLVHMASVGSLRYRVPIEPMLAVLAAAGVGAIRFPTMNYRRAGAEET